MLTSTSQVRRWASIGQDDDLGNYGYAGLAAGAEGGKTSAWPWLDRLGFAATSHDAACGVQARTEGRSADLAGADP